jgi:hypothetical protein
VSLCEKVRESAAVQKSTITPSYRPAHVFVRYRCHATRRMFGFIPSKREICNSSLTAKVAGVADCLQSNKNCRILATKFTQNRCQTPNTERSSTTTLLTKCKHRCPTTSAFAHDLVMHGMFICFSSALGYNVPHLVPYQLLDSRVDLLYSATRHVSFIWGSVSRARNHGCVSSGVGLVEVRRVLLPAQNSADHEPFVQRCRGGYE